MDWLHQPLALVQALADQMPRLEAEERLGSITDIAVATGSTRKSMSSRHMRSLRRAAGEESRPATPADLMELGFEVVNG